MRAHLPSGTPRSDLKIEVMRPKSQKPPARRQACSHHRAQPPATPAADRNGCPGAAAHAVPCLRQHGSALSRLDEARWARHRRQPLVRASAAPLFMLDGRALPMTDQPPHSPSGSNEAEAGHAQADDAALDERALAQLRALDPDGRHDVLGRVLSAFAASLQRVHEQLRDPAVLCDPRALGVIAHTLKSSSASVGALGLSRLCAEAERAARAGELQRLNAAAVALQAESVRVLGLVGAMLRA
jgi:histidine phosphotransfer protein HptB